MISSRLRLTRGGDVGQKSNLAVSGEASNDQDFIELINQAQLKQGQPLLHSEYDTLKRNLISLAQQKVTWMDVLSNRLWKSFQV